MLADERLNDGESLTGTRSTNYPCSSERIHDIHPTFAELALVVIAHRDVYAILVLLQFLALLKRLVLEVETVFEQSFLQELGDIVEGNMDADGTKNRGSHVKPDVQTDGIEPHIHTMTEKPYRQYGNEQSTHQRIEHLTASIKLQMFLVSGANASDTDKHDGSNLAPYEVAIHIDEPPLYTAMNVTNNATPIVKQRWVYSILKELHYQ